VIDITVIDVQK